MRKNIQASVSSRKRRRPRRQNIGGNRLSAITTDTRLIPYNAQNVFSDQHFLKKSVDQIYRCRRTFISGAFTQTNAETFGGIVGQLSFVNDAAGLIAVFDCYRIVGMEVQFKCTIGEQMTAESGSLTSVLDFDDAVALGSLAAALDYSSAITTKVRENQRRCFVPRVAPAIFQSGAFSGYGTSLGVWLNTASSTIQHYGVKWALDPYTSAGAAMTVTPFVTLEMEFRASR